MGKRGPAVEINTCPACGRFLAARGVRPPYDGFDDRALAQFIIGEGPWSDKDLVIDGTVDFKTMDGAALIRAVEELLTGGLRQHRGRQMMPGWSQNKARHLAAMNWNRKRRRP